MFILQVLFIFIKPVTLTPHPNLICFEKFVYINMAEYESTPKRGESWYNVKLPKDMTKLNSVQGQKLLKECTVRSLSVIKSFVKQRHRTLCGPCSVAIVGNALGLGTRILSGRSANLNENNIINHERVRHFADQVKLLQYGATLQQMAYLVARLGIGVSAYHVGVGETTINSKVEHEQFEYSDHVLRCQSVAEFNDIVKDAAVKKSFIILNYHMGALGYVDCGGHFRPVGAYSDYNKRLLILDTWPETPPAWVKSCDLFKAMSTVDPTSQKPRGFLILKEEMVDSCSDNRSPTSCYYD